MTGRRRFLHEKLRSLYLWHRYLGLVLCLFVIWLAISGMALNHSDDLSLAQKPIANQWLLSIYNVEAAKIESRRSGDVWISRAGSDLYWNSRAVARCNRELLTVYRNDFQSIPGVWVVCGQSLQFFTDGGEAVLELPQPAGIEAALWSANGLQVKSSQRWWTPDSEYLQWVKGAAPAAASAHSQPASLPSRSGLPNKIERDIQRQYQGQALSWERFLLDAHSGRILGQWGVWLADAVAVLMVALALSGCLVWWRRRRLRRRASGGHSPR